MDRNCNNHKKAAIFDHQIMIIFDRVEMIKYNLVEFKVPVEKYVSDCLF